MIKNHDVVVELLRAAKAEKYWMLKHEQRKTPASAEHKAVWDSSCEGETNSVASDSH